MAEHKSDNPSVGADAALNPWHVPVAVEDVPDTGLHFDLVADAQARAAIARLAGLRDLPRLEAHFDVTRHGAGGLQGLHVTGHVSGSVGQTCVITLEPLVNEVEEAVDLLFLPQVSPQLPAGDTEVGEETKWDEPEPLVGGRIDLGAIATEFLILGLDPYPRKPGVVFQPPPETAAPEGPFAALAGLKKGRDGR